MDIDLQYLMLRKLLQPVNMEQMGQMFEYLSKEWWEGRVILDNCIANLLLLPGLMPYQGIKTQRHIFN